MGGVKWVSNPCVGVKDEEVCHSDAECSYPPRGTYTDCKGVALYPLNNQTRIDSQCTRTCSSKEWGVMYESQSTKLSLEIAPGHRLLAQKYGSKRDKALATKGQAAKEGLSVQETERVMNIELFLEGQTKWEADSPHHFMMLYEMFQHTADQGQKEAANRSYQSWILRHTYPLSSW